MSGGRRRRSGGTMHLIPPSLLGVHSHASSREEEDTGRVERQ